MTKDEFNSAMPEPVDGKWPIDDMLLLLGHQLCDLEEAITKSGIANATALTKGLADIATAVKDSQRVRMVHVKEDER